MTLTLPVLPAVPAPARLAPPVAMVSSGPEVHRAGDRAEGDERVRDANDALTALYTEHYRSLVRLAATLLDDPSLSEEVVQDAYVKMYGRWGRIKEADAALGYLRTTVLNLARSRMRRRLVARKHLPKPMPDAPAAEVSAMESVEHDRVLQALRTLPERQRQVLVLRYYEDLSEADIAATIGISRGAVKTHASRGMKALREVLGGTP